MMTTADRETWAATYSKLLEIPGNKGRMEKLASALFLVCLDPHIPTDLVSTSEVHTLPLRPSLPPQTWYCSRPRWFCSDLVVVTF